MPEKKNDAEKVSPGSGNMNTRDDFDDDGLDDFSGCDVLISKKQKDYIEGHLEVDYFLYMDLKSKSNSYSSYDSTCLVFSSLVFIGSDDELYDVAEFLYSLHAPGNCYRFTIDCTGKTSREVEGQIERDREKSRTKQEYEMLELHNIHHEINPLLRELVNNFINRDPIRNRIVATSSNIDDVAGLCKPFKDACAIFDLTAKKQLAVSDIPAPTPKAETPEPRAQSERHVKTAKMPSAAKKQALDSFEDANVSLENRPELIEYISTWPTHRKYLLLKNDANNEARAIADTLLSVMTFSNHIDKTIYVEDCANKSCDELMNTVIHDRDNENLESKVLVLHQVSRGSNEFLSKMLPWFLKKQPQLVIVVLKNGMNENELPSGVVSIFNVISLLEIVLNDKSLQILINGNDIYQKYSLDAYHFKFFELIYTNWKDSPDEFKTMYEIENYVWKDANSLVDSNISQGICYKDSQIYNIKNKFKTIFENESYGISIENRSKSKMHPGGYRLVI